MRAHVRRCYPPAAAARCAQSLVEFALVAPILLILLVASLDAGLALRDYLILQSAAREGARLAAAGFSGDVPITTIRDTVAREAGDLTVLNDPAHIDVTYPDPNTVRVTVLYDYTPFTPFARSIWGDTVQLRGSATFFDPKRTATPPPITPSTPVPTPTPTATPSPLPTITPTATPTPTPVPPTPTPSPTPAPGPCAVPLAIPGLSDADGYWYPFASAGPGTITVNWTVPAADTVEVDVYPGSPFAGFTNPTHTTPPGGKIAGQVALTTVLVVATTSRPAGAYTAYFFYTKEGGHVAASSGTVTYVTATCP